MSRGSRTGRTGPKGAVALAAATIAALAASSANAQEPVGPYDGSNPFRCQLQDVGSGTDFPDPDADPFCVKFDKTSQNVTDFGLVDFLANEPNRVAAAAPKCFYYQRDHWTGSVEQGSDPELWNWIGSYFFDKAAGLGGVHVRDFRVGGVPFDATPYAPEAYRPYLEGTGGGGVRILLESDPDPACAARVDTPQERQAVYRDAPGERDCVPPGGRLRGRRVGVVRLGMGKAKVRGKLGAPAKHRRGVDRWCVIGDASLRVAYGDGRVNLIRTSSRGHGLAGVAPGDRAAKARRLLGNPDFRVAGARVIARSSKLRQALVGARGKRVRWIALARPSADGARALQRAR